MKRNLPSVLAQLVQYAPTLLARRFRHNCCIGATKVAIEVLERLGFMVRPQPTQLMVYTRRLWRRVESNTFDRPFLHGEYSVGVGFDPGTGKQGGYIGHLVALAAEPAAVKTMFLIDLSLGQASRPKKGIYLPPAIFLASNKININKCVLMYRPIDNPKFLESPDWTKAERTEPIVEELLRIIK